MTNKPTDDQGYTRTCEPTAPFKPDGETTTAPCRDCGQDVEVAAITLVLVRAFSRALKNRGERHLDRGEIVLCEICGQRFEMKRKREADAARDLWRKIREAAKPLDELRRAPQWFRTREKDEITKFLAGINGLSTRKAPKGMDID